MKKMFVLLVIVLLLVGIMSGCVEEENKKPTAGFSIDPETNIYVDTTITFSDTSDDKDGTIESWMWDFGDETNSTDSGPIEHSYDEIGTYTVTLTVTDNDDAESDIYSMNIEVTLKDIVTTAVDSGFSTLATALTAADLVDTLKGEGPFTVFAPTNDAFDALNQTWLTALLDDVTNLTLVLKYHVVSGQVMSSDLTDGEVMTLEGTNVTIAIDGTNVTVNGVLVTTADVECSNGVIHIIGEVLLPESVPGP